MRAPKSRVNAPRIVSAGATGLSGSAADRCVAHAHAQERTLELPLQLVDVEVERIGVDADNALPRLGGHMK